MIEQSFALTDVGVIRAPLHGHPVWRFLTIWLGAGMIYLKSGDLIFWATGYPLPAIIISIALLVTIARWFMNYWPRDLIRAAKILGSILFVISAIEAAALYRADPWTPWHDRIVEMMVQNIIYAGVLSAYAYVASRRLKKPGVHQSATEMGK